MRTLAIKYFIARVWLRGLAIRHLLKLKDMSMTYGNFNNN
jgi:hypothetical protein